MSIEEIVKQIATLSDSDLKKVAEYIEYLKQ